VIDLRQERFESVPEFVREPQTSTRESLKTSIMSAFKRERVLSKKVAYSNAAYNHAAYNASYGNGGNGSTATIAGAKPTYEDLEFSGLETEFVHPKSAELETLWPGVGQDFLQANEQRGPGFYLSLGFFAGAVMSLAGLWFYAWLTHSSLSYIPNLSSAKKMIVTAARSVASNKVASSHSAQASTTSSAEVTTLVPTGANSADLVVPAFSIYEVKTGDTLAVIAGKAYHRVSPRLLDAICRANGLHSADVLSLGQKLNLPEYRPSINQFTAAQ
jgi:LysM repeat protein